MMSRPRAIAMIARAASLAIVLAVPGAGWAAPEQMVADFGTYPVTAAARGLAERIVASSDTHGLPFVIVDKVAARAFAFDATGKIRGAAPVLLGGARGDVSPPGIGTRKLADITPAERITPAGRFAAALGRNFSHDVLWIDYDAAVSLHRVVTSNPAEHRLARLASPVVADHRISYGCVNVPPAFYEDVVVPLFAPANGVVYVMPDVAPLDAVFGSMGRPQGPMR